MWESVPTGAHRVSERGRIESPNARGPIQPHSRQALRYEKHSHRRLGPKCRAGLALARICALTYRLADVSSSKLGQSRRPRLALNYVAQAVFYQDVEPDARCSVHWLLLLSASFAASKEQAPTRCRASAANQAALLRRHDLRHKLLHSPVELFFRGAVQHRF